MKRLSIVLVLTVAGCNPVNSEPIDSPSEPIVFQATPDNPVGTKPPELLKQCITSSIEAIPEAALLAALGPVVNACAKVYGPKPELQSTATGTAKPVEPKPETPKK